MFATKTNNSSANNFIISGAGKITGAAGIVKDGTSTLTLSTSNDFTGTVTVKAGTELVEGPHVAETFPVRVENNYVVVEA